ncbi:hypothetical protein V6N13_135850 [Hibiscus sabdariffa]|uniref:Uncharacterized protein n=2 Tax=Hibiscus sabdariffa TaxID=183260 RepID=A0ABR2QSW2_9ROSI
MIQCLNGFRLFGFLLKVSFAQYNIRSSFWKRKASTDLRNKARMGVENKKGLGLQSKELVKGNEDRNDKFQGIATLIQGVIDQEKLNLL